MTRRSAHLRPTPRRGILGLALPAILLAACSAGAAHGSPVESTPSPAAATATPVAATATPVAATPAPTPVASTDTLGSVDRPTDVPTDGTCVPTHECIGLLGPGPHHSAVFAPGFAFTTAKAGWENLEEVAWILPILPIDHPGDAVVFLKGPRISAQDGSILPSVGADVQSMVAWITADPNLQVGAPVDVHIGGLAGTRIDVANAPGAPNQDPQCPAHVCQGLLAGPSKPGEFWGWGLAGTEKLRIYLLAGKAGTVAIVVDSLDGKTFDDLAGRASELLATVKFD